MSLRRPLAGALPSGDTLKRGFDALLNAESKIYLYEGPDHSGIRAPTDRLSIYTCMPSFKLLMGFTDAGLQTGGDLSSLSYVCFLVPGLIKAPSDPRVPRTGKDDVHIATQLAWSDRLCSTRWHKGIGALRRSTKQVYRDRGHSRARRYYL